MATLSSQTSSSTVPEVQSRLATALSVDLADINKVTSLTEAIQQVESGTLARVEEQRKQNLEGWDKVKNKIYRRK